MTLTQMKYFSTACDLQNISMAAKILYISQPALSSALADMEEEVGFKLFQRRSRGIYPTEEGRMLLEHINAILKRTDMLTQDLPLIAKHQNIIKVGCRPYAGENSFFQIYKAFEQENNDVILKVNEMSKPRPYLYLDENQLDFMVASLASMPDEWKQKYECYHVGTEEVRFFVHKDSEFAKKEVVTFDDFTKLSLVFWEGQQLFLNRIQSILASQNRSLNVIATVPQQTGILHFIYNNLAGGFLAGDYLKSISDIVEVHLSQKVWDIIGPPEIEIYIFWKKDCEKYHGKKVFADYIRKTFQRGA